MTMAMPAAVTATAALPARWQDFVQLMKPRVMSLVVFTAVTGLVCADHPIHPVLAAVAVLCIAVGAGASGALNMWYDADIDAKMRRTRGRPVPAGRVQGADALALGVILSLFSVMLLGMAVNWLAAGLLAFTILFYAVVYTMWLKRSTPQNIVIGGLAGALPPVIGWAAATGSVPLNAWLLCAIIFMWTPPHFWALSLYTSEDYAKAGVPMMPVTAGAQTDPDLQPAVRAGGPGPGGDRPGRRTLSRRVSPGRARVPDPGLARLSQPGGRCGRHPSEGRAL
jgi:protoheme IX farnesyltransferase